MSARRVYVTKRKGDEVQEQIYLTPPSIKESYSGWFDPCPHPRPSWDGLEVDWEAKTFCNPPWRKTRPWVEKASKERTKGKEVHLLLPASPNTAVFHDLIFPEATEVQWLRGDTPYHRVSDNKQVKLGSCIVKFAAAGCAGS